MNTYQISTYHIRIEPDLDRFRFAGQVDIDINTSSPTASIRLNALDLSIAQCSVNFNGNRQACLYNHDASMEELHIDLPEPLVGDFQLSIGYSGGINAKMAGFYRSSYSAGKTREFIAVTQFQESAARMAFPCQDHPERKARFEISLVVAEHLTAVSNTRVKAIYRKSNGKKQVSFYPTPVMSTYLVFWGVGRFEFLGDTEDPRLGVMTTPGLIAYGKFGLEFGRKALKFCEDYYAIDYPLGKMDLLAVPDFAFGAMENWGAITFRENRLLDFPQSTSQTGRMQICEVIAHEIAHQWFGNLVTPSDWRYLWLNESFATYFGFGVVDHYYPQWRVWEQFIHTQTQSAFFRDSMVENFPIEIPGGEHVVINTSTAPLIYSKGGSILRQIEGVMGQDLFRKGIQAYLNDHIYGCAASHHLWEAFERVSEMPITEVMQSWIEQPGHPVIDVRRDGQSLYLSQQRFTYLPYENDQLWKIPVNVSLFSKDGQCRNETLLMDGKTARLELEEDDRTYKLNPGQTGFYRVRYLDADNREKLLDYVGQKKLALADRWGLQMDLFAQILCGNANISDYLDSLSYYSGETAYLPLISIMDHLYLAYRILDSRWHPPISAAGCFLAERIFNRIGWEPENDAAQTTTRLRDHILWPAAIFGYQAAIDFSAKLFGQMQAGTAVHPDVQKSVLQIAALAGDEDTLIWLKESAAASISEHERINLFTAMGCFRSWDQIDAALAFTLDQVPMRNRFIPIVSAAENPHAAPFMWNWYSQNVGQLEQIHPLLYERIIAAIVPLCGWHAAIKPEDFFSERLKLSPLANDAIRLSLERLAVYTLMRQRHMTLTPELPVK